MPIAREVEGKAEIGKMVRIQSFAERDEVVVADNVQTKEFVCEKCGHINRE